MWNVICTITKSKWLQSIRKMMRSVQRILPQGEVSMNGRPPVYFVWIQLLCLRRMNNFFTSLVKSKPVKQEISCIGMVLLLVSVLWECLFGGKSRRQNRIIFVYRHGAVSKMRSWRPLLQRDVVVDLDLSGVVRHDMGQEVAEIRAALGRRAVEAHRFLWKTNRQNVQHMLDV